MPDITANNLTLDEATDGLPADAAADNIQQKRTHTIIKALQSKSQQVQHHLMRRDQKTVLMMKLILTDDVCALECMLMMLEPRGSG